MLQTPPPPLAEYVSSFNPIPMEQPQIPMEQPQIPMEQPQIDHEVGFKDLHDILELYYAFIKPWQVIYFVFNLLMSVNHIFYSPSKIKSSAKDIFIESILAPEMDFAQMDNDIVTKMCFTSDQLHCFLNNFNPLKYEFESSEKIKTDIFHKSKKHSNVVNYVIFILFFLSERYNIQGITDFLKSEINNDKCNRNFKSICRGLRHAANNKNKGWYTHADFFQLELKESAHKPKHCNNGEEWQDNQDSQGN